MVSLRRILKDYRDTGSLHSLVSIQAAIGDGVFITRSGDLVTLLTLRGIHYECLDAGQLEAIAHRFGSAVRVFDERFRLYQYLLKQLAPPLPFQHHGHPVVEEALVNRADDLASKPHYSVEIYMAVVYEGWRPPVGLRERLTPRAFAARHPFSTPKTIDSLTSGLDAARELITNKVATFATQLRDSTPTERLDNERAFRFLRRLLNYQPCKSDGVGLKYDRFVDFQACGSSLECHPEFLRLDEDYVRVLTLKEPPAKTFAHMLRRLLELPSNFVIASEWKPETPATVRRLIGSKRRHFHNLKTSLATHLSSSSPTTPQDRLVDDGAVALVDSLGGCLEEIEIHGRIFGQFSLSVVLYDQDAAALRRSVTECFKIFAMHDAQLIEERYNRLNAWLAVVPANSAFNLRRLWLSDENYADLSFLYTIDRGQVRNEHLRAEYLAVLEGPGDVPYFFNLHCGDVAHTLVLGATGSGKSFLLNFLITHLQKYQPFTYIFDLGGSYKTLTRLFEGSYLSVGAQERSFTINPFSLPPTPENLLFLFAFIRVLIESNHYRLSAEDERDLYEQIENLYSVSPEQRRLSTLSSILRRNMGGPLRKWVQGGPYGALFDNAEDTLSFARFQAFDFEGMDRTPDQLEPLLFYILHRANAAIGDVQQASVFKAFVMDEAWRFFRHPVIKAYIVEALKTWRKKEAAMILATQSGEDLIRSEMLPIALESCPTKLFLANAGIDRDTYRKAFHLNETEAELITNLIPKREMLLKQPEGSRRLALNVDRKGYWLYTNNPRDNQRKNEAFARYGFHEGLEQLARGNA